MYCEIGIVSLLFGLTTEKLEPVGIVLEASESLTCAYKSTLHAMVWSVSSLQKPANLFRKPKLRKEVKRPE